MWNKRLVTTAARAEVELGIGEDGTVEVDQPKPLEVPRRNNRTVAEALRG